MAQSNSKNPNGAFTACDTCPKQALTTYDTCPNQALTTIKTCPNGALTTCKTRQVANRDVEGLVDLLNKSKDFASIMQVPVSVCSCACFCVCVDWCVRSRIGAT